MRKLFFFTLILASLFISSCKKDNADVQANLKVNFKVGGSAFEFNKVYTIGGTAVSFTKAQFYLCNVMAIDDEGNKNDYTTKYFLVKPGGDAVNLGTFSLDHIHELAFTIGIDSATNHSDPTTRGDSDPLSATAGMHWSWNSGYIFTMLEGLVDTDGNGTPDAEMKIHIGGDEYRRDNTITFHQELDKDATTIPLCADIDLAQLLSGITLATDHSTHSMDNPTLAEKVANNNVISFTKGNCQ